MITVFNKLKYERLICFTNKLMYKSTSNYLHIEHLKSRSLIEVEGPNADEFLQGMITNDIRLLNDASSIYTMFLNVQGRILFDSFIFKCQPYSYIVDCDSTAVQPLINHLKLHKVRRKINFKPLEEVMKVCALYDKDLIEGSITDQTNFESDLSCLSNSVINILPDNAIVARDSRLNLLGDRILLPIEYPLSELSNIYVSKGDYKVLRLKLGIGEGVEELKRGKSLPMEVNCDYLHGVSFQKGCYVGQELTARTYHTGVVRKRYMPLTFCENNTMVQPNDTIVNEKGKSVGKIIVNEGIYGIGLMRIAESLDSSSLNIGEVTVKTFKPRWWPI